MAVVVITGSNGGFGMAAALAFGRRGDTVFCTVRQLERAQDLRRVAEQERLDLRIKTLDLTRPDTFDSFTASVLREAGRIDVLVNNAGILRPGAWEDLPESSIREVMETNFFGPMLLTRAMLPLMRDQASGCIIMISSLSGLAGLAGDACYSASKFALEGATEALRHEVDRWGIRVALVEAGRYATELFREADQLPPAHPGDSPYRPLVQSQIRDLDNGRKQAMPASKVGELLPRIADADGSQLRWPADDMAQHVLNSLLGQSDSERDDFLRAAGGSDWWSKGLATPETQARDT